MFEKLVNKIAKPAVESAKTVVKEEITKSADDILPTIIGLASMALLIFASVPPNKSVPANTTNITINNYYFGR